MEKELARFVFATVQVLNEYGVAPRTTTIQKVVYLVLASRGTNGTTYSFVPFLHGPYSADVAYVLEALVLAGFIREECDEWGYRRFRVSGKKQLPEVEVVREVVKRLHELSPSIFDDLPRLISLAETQWLKSKYPREAPEELAKRGQELGWKITTENIRTCLSWLEEVLKT